MEQSKSRYVTVWDAGVQVLAVRVFKIGQKHQTKRKEKIRREEKKIKYKQAT